MFNFIIQALNGLFTIVFVVGIGIVLSYKGWFDEKSSKLIAKLVTTVSLPLYIITNLVKHFTAEKLLALALDMLLPIASMLLAMVLGIITAKLFGVERGRRGVFITNFFIANTMFIGLPVNLALFGDESIPSVMLYYIVNLVFFWTLGVHNIIADVEKANNNLFSFDSLKNVVSPPLMGFMVALVLVFFNISLPDCIYKGFQYVGNLTTPLSLIFIGIEINKIKFSDFSFGKDIWGALLGRFIICPFCVLLLAPWMNVAEISVKVFTMQAAMPAMTQMAILAKQYNADSNYAATISFMTILLGLLVIPFYMVIVNIYF